MGKSDSRTLINNGRKAGLNTREIYDALATRPPETQAPNEGAADGNGFVLVYMPHGRRVYRPARTS
jgi:hypothetical protein